MKMSATFDPFDQRFPFDPIPCFLDVCVPHARIDCSEDTCSFDRYRRQDTQASFTRSEL